LIGGVKGSGASITSTNLQASVSNPAQTTDVPDMLLLPSTSSNHTQVSAGHKKSADLTMESEDNIVVPVVQKNQS